MSANDLAQRYGLALLMLAEKQSVQHRVADELNALVALIGREPMLKSCLANPTFPTAVKQAILDELMAPAFCRLTRDFIGLLVRARREDVLAEVAQVLETRLREADGLVKVLVESAWPMTDSDQADFTRRIARWLDKKVELEARVAPELVAGITIQIGDHLIDASCRGQLARMRQLLMT